MATGMPASLRRGAWVLAAALAALAVWRYQTEPAAPPGAVTAAPAAERVPVDVNTADSAAFAALPYIGPATARRIVRYRAAAGPFRTWDDFGRMYGMDTLLPRIRPYLALDTAGLPPARTPSAAATVATAGPPADLNRIPAEELVRRRLLPEQLARRLVRYRDASGGFRDWAHVGRAYGMTPDLLARLQQHTYLHGARATARQRAPVDLNTADSAALERLPGIGPTYARRIVAYRQRLGFYVSVAQLREVYGITDSTLAVVQPHLVLGGDSSAHPRLDINQATEAELARHPYVGRTLARRIVAYRAQHGTFWDLATLRRIEGVTDAQWARLQPYLRLQ